MSYDHRGSGQGGRQPAAAARDAAGVPGKRTLTETLPAKRHESGAMVRDTEGANGGAAASADGASARLTADDAKNGKPATEQMKELLAMGAGMKPSDAIRARDLLFSLDGDQFRTALKSAMRSGAFSDMLCAMGIWEGMKTLGRLKSEVVVPTTLLKPAADKINDDFLRANEIFNPHGIQVKQGKQIVLSEKASKKILGDDNSLDEFEADSATAEELKLIEENRAKGRVTGYWIPGMSSRGEMIGKPYIKNIKEDRTSVVVNTAAREQDTFAHELGHALGLGHESINYDNLMAEGGMRNTSGPEIDQMSPEQLDIIMKSLFIEFGKMGGK